MMKVYVVADTNYDGGVLGVWVNREEAELQAKKHNWDNPKVANKYEYYVYEKELVDEG